MKNILLIFFISIFAKSVGQNVGGYYTFANITPTVAYAPITTATVLVHPANSLDLITAAIAMPIVFKYGCVTQPSLVISSNGWISFNTALSSTSSGPNKNNDLDNVTNNFTTPNIIAPLWDALRTQTLTGTGIVRYNTAGVSPNRIMTIEWLNMQWGNTGLTATSRISFQLRLYETTDVIEFKYRQDNVGTQSDPIPSANASIGLMGGITGDFISIDNTPSASTSVETSTLNNRPVNNALYRFTPITCSGIPVSGSAKATPSVSCSDFTTTLSLTGNTGGCGINYQWSHCNTIAGTYTLIGTPVSTSNQTFAIVNGTPKFFKCDVICTTNTVTTAAISASVGPGGMGAGSFSVTAFPATYSGSTTCGQGNDLYTTATTGSITNACSGINYIGSDVVYIFTPTVTSAFTATLTQPPAGENLSLSLYNGCPTSTGVCVTTNTILLNSIVGPVNTNTIGTCTNMVEANKTYYLIIDAQSTANGCNTYSLNLGLTSAPTTTANTACNLGYTATTIASATVAFTGVNLRPSMAATGDNSLSSYISFFPFCFDGNYYNGGYVSDNSSFIFATLPCLPNIRATNSASAGAVTGFSITSKAPVFGTDVPRNAILAPWHDLSPISSTVATTVIQYTVIGATPTRTAIISWEDVPMVSCVASASRGATQIKLFENSSKIEIHIRNKKTCVAQNAGKAILGLHNYNGTIFVPANSASLTAMEGTSTFTLANTAYQFLSTCSSNISCVTILPIGFKDFYGDKIDNINTLFWSTAMEQNMLYFTIERSYDGINFEQIAAVNANNTPSNYEYKDYDVKAGLVAYYRLKSVEENNVYSYTKIVSIGEGNSETLSTWPIYPNPTNSEINIRLNSKKNGFANFIVYDILGNTVINETQNIEVGVNVHAVNVSALKRGVYYIEMQNNLNEVISKQKLVVN